MNTKTLTPLLGSLILALAGCGGGGSDTTTTAAPAAAHRMSDAQGYWSGPLAGGSLQSATSTQGVVLADGTAWFLLIPASGAATGMVKAALAVSDTGYTGSGTVYDFAAASAAPIAVSGVAVAGSSQSSVFTPTGAASATTASLAYSNAYETAAVLADMRGAWQVSASSGALRIDWTVLSDGTLTGTSTTGCTWTGAFNTRTEGKAVMNFAASETCVSVTTGYSGIAVLDAAKTGATLFVTTAGDAQGFVLAMSKVGA
jgi:hypothetical protein